MTSILTALTLLEYPGAILGLVGAILVASTQAHRRRAGFLCWIISNLCLMTVFAQAGMWPLLGMQSVYLVTAIMGWRNHRQP